MSPLLTLVIGWGPLSPDGRADITPCFLGAVAGVVDVGLVLTGATQLYILLQRKPYPVPTNWHYWLKLATVVLLLAPQFLLASIQQSHSAHWQQDTRFWFPILGCVALLLALTIHHVEHSRSKIPSGVLLFYWVFFIAIYGLQLRQSVSLQEYRNNVPRLVALSVTECLGFVIFILEWLVPKRWTPYGTLGDDGLECPATSATIFSRLTFSWMTPMMKLGYTKFLTEDDMWDLRRKDSTKVVEERLISAWEWQSKRKNPNLWLALFRAFGAPFALGALFKVVQDILTFTQPQLLRLLISFAASYSTDSPEPVIKGLGIAMAMFAVSVVQTMCLHQYLQRVSETGLRVKTGLTGIIYRKSMRLSNEGRVAKSVGDIVNLQAVDTEKLHDLTQEGQYIWSAPFQITLCMVSLYQLLGPSMFAGIGAMLIMVPVNGVITSVMKKLRKRQMEYKDQRTRLMTEILNHMKAIKLYGWAAPFKQKLDSVRDNQELVILKRIGVAQAFINFIWVSTPFLVSCSTFSVFVWTSGQPLTTEIVFPALALFNLLNYPLAMFAIVITAIAESSVTVSRITSFLTADELQTDAVVYEDAVTETGQETVRLADATFGWEKDKPGGVLKNINFSAAKGDLSCIIGKVGSGKSSFLGALVGELWRREGQAIVRGSVAYVPQQCFIMNASIKENILFGHRYDPEFYEKTVQACALFEDFAVLPDGDETQVGEKGISLSGGQKARVTLARAVYARADVYVLDDPLSAVDQHVGKHLMESVFGQSGLLASKTRIMATNSIPVLRNADRVTLIIAGEFVESGSYDEVMTARGAIYNIIKHMKEDKSDSDDQLGDGLAAVETQAPSPEPGSELEDGILDVPGVKPVPMQKIRRSSFRRASIASLKNRRRILDIENAPAKRTAVTREHSERGKVKWAVYIEYAKACSRGGILFYFLGIFGSRTAQVAGSFWLKKWSEVNSKRGTNPDAGWYAGIYFAIGICSSALAVGQILILWIFCAIEASRKLHEKMAISVFSSPMSFFETTPAGRILNRFSNDIYRIDETLCRCFNMLFHSLIGLLATLAIVSTTTPPFIAMVFPLAFLCSYVQRYYLRTSRELKRLVSVSRSPIYANFQETLGGISTIRAYRQQDRFIKENELRIDENIRVQFPSICANRWLAIRLEFIGSVVILGSAGFAILSVASGGGLSAGAVGLAMSYALKITQSLNLIVRQTVDIETNIVSVERTLEYSTLPSEAPDVTPDNRPSSGWPSEGAIEFKNYSTRYRPELDLIVKNVDLKIKPGEKVGIVGRTGAGKSSLSLALFRIIEPAEGSISIDNLDISTIGLQDLRQRLSIIPQDPSIFEGTIRDNLDPRHTHDDTELWSALEKSHLKEKVSSMDGGLDARVHEDGSNLSGGEKALVSLARALLTPSNILVMDEATGSLDTVTDRQIQEVIRQMNSTIITIGHRLETVIYYDRIVVLDKGEIKEAGHPYELLQNDEGLFCGMCKSTGGLEALREMASEVYHPANSAE